jgi:hypothetical protein
MLGPISMAFFILSFHCARDFAQGLGGGRGELWGANLPEDAAKREVQCAPSEEMRARRERETGMLSYE